MKPEKVLLCTLVVAVIAFLVAGDAVAQTVNLNSAFSNASSQLRGYAKTGVTIGGFICTMISLGLAGWKFMNKEPAAVWQIVGVVVGGVLFMAAQAL